MKKILTILMMAILAAGVGWAGAVTFADLGLENGVQYSDPFDGGDFTVTFAGGGNNGKYYTTGAGIRVYGGGSMIVAAKSGTITEITVTYDSGNDYRPSSADVVNVGTYNASTGVWTGNANSVVFTRPLGSGHWRVKSVSATVTVGSVATPVISGTTPFEGSTQVSISCETSGAQVYYTTDGSEPTTSSTQYSAPFTITETTTVKAIAALNGETSGIASKTFTILYPISSVAGFNALNVNDNFKYTADNLVYIKSNESGNNHYVQDGSKGMLIYGNLGKTYTAGDVIPSGFTGTRAEYNGAPEMTNPDGFGAPMRNTGLTPLEVSSSEVTLDNFGRYVVLKNVAINGNNLVVDGVNVSFHNSLEATLPTETEGKIFDVTGVVGAYNSNAQILPIEFTDVTPVTGPQYYLAGNFNGWGDAVNSEVNKFTKRADGSYILNNVELAEGVEFKIIKVDNGSTTWYGGTVTDGGSNYGVNGNVHNNLPLDNTDNGKNFKLEVAGTNDFVISSDMKLTINRDAQLYMKGSYSNDDWATKTPLTATNDGWTITMDMAAHTEFGFVDEWDTWHGGNGTEVTMDTELPMGANGNYIIPADGNYTITVNSALTKLVVTDNNAVIEGGYVKVTSADELTSGTYLIVYEGGSLAFNGGLETLDAVGNSIAVTINNSTIPSSNEVDAATFTYDKTTGTFKSASGYYIGQTKYENGLASSATTAYSNTVTIDADCNAVITSQAGPTLRFNAASNQTRFRYYKSGQKAIQLYKKSGEVAPTLPTPVIDGDSPFLGSTTVTISCEDTEAEVRYTLDGTDPTAESTLYEAPFTITETTTVKAIAMKGEAFSGVASKEFKKTLSVATIAEYKQIAQGNTFVFTGNVTVTYVNGRNLYIKDDTGSALIYGDENFNFEQGQVLDANWSATTTVYNGLLEAKSPSNLAVTDQTVEVSPVEKSLRNITTANDNEYIIVKNVTITAVDNKNFTITDANGNTIVGRTNFTGVDHPTDLDAKYDITCLVGEYNSTVQLYPTDYKRAAVIEPVVLEGVAFTADRQWATWYGDASLALPEGVTAYVVTGVQGDAVAVEALDYIPANTGVLLHSETAAESVSAMPYTGEAGTIPTNLLMGGLETQTVSNAYLLYNNQFILAQDGTTVGAHRCYLPMSASAQGVPVLKIGTPGTVTGIETISTNGNGDNTYYNLMGQPVANPTPGIYIRGGKKVIVK